MIRTTLKVEGMSCAHCVNAVSKAVAGLDGVFEVEVDLEAKTVNIEYDAEKVSIESIKHAIEEEGYDVI